MCSAPPYYLRSEGVEPSDSGADYSPSEMLPYARPLRSVGVGEVGKRGFLRLGFEVDSRGRTILRDWERRVPLIVQQALYFDEELPQMACVYILSSGGANIEGDRYEQIFTLRPGAMAHISTGAATKIAQMYRNFSSLRQLLRLERESYLEYLPEPVIPSRHARYAVLTQIDIDPTATLIYGECYLSGRRYYGGGERFDYDILSVAQRVRSLDGELLYSEKFIISPSQSSPQQRGIMGDYELFGNLLILAPQEPLERVYSQVEPLLSEAMALGVTRLAQSRGLLIRILARRSEDVKRKMRQVASILRQEVKGKSLGEDFVWR